MIETSQSSPIESIQSQDSEPDKPQETLWKWIETELFHITIPHTWRVDEPTNENLSRVWVLNKDIPGMEKHFYAFLQEESHITDRIKMPGLKGQMRRYLLLSDNTDLSLLTAIVFHSNSPIPITRWLERLVVSTGIRQTIAFMCDTFELIHIETQKINVNNGLILIFKFKQDKIFFLLYSRFQYGQKNIISFMIICEEDRYQKEQANFERLARSVQFEVKD